MSWFSIVFPFWLGDVVSLASLFYPLENFDVWFIRSIVGTDVVPREGAPLFPLVRVCGSVFPAPVEGVPAGFGSFIFIFISLGCLSILL